MNLYPSNMKYSRSQIKFRPLNGHIDHRILSAMVKIGISLYRMDKDGNKIEWTLNEIKRLLPGGDDSDTILDPINKVQYHREIFMFDENKQSVVSIEISSHGRICTINNGLGKPMPYKAILFPPVKLVLEYSIYGRLVKSFKRTGIGGSIEFIR